MGKISNGMKKGSKKKHEIKANLRGPISLTQKGVGYVRVEGWKEDIEVDARHLRTALHGDTVEIFLHPRKGKRQTAEVTQILSRAKSGFAGVLIKNNGAYILEPDDTRMYTNILVLEKDLNGAKPGDKVFGKIILWKDQKSMPEGVITDIFGRPGENNAEMLSIARERGFDASFSEEIEREAKNIKERGISESDYAGRKDFRKTLTFTIDPDNAKDFDDAISFRQISEEEFEIGVHIADVTHYVRENSAIEEEARRRGTSVYLVDRTIPMLPEVLSNDLCSLVPYTDRLTMSAVFVLDRQARVKKSWFGPAVINSNKRFTYEEAEDAITNPSAPFHQEVRTLNDLAKKLTEERTELGAMLLDSEEVKFELAPDGTPLKVIKKTYGDANKLIEEFMLLANKKVAELISQKEGKLKKGLPAQAGKKSGPVFVYRVHDLPSKEKMEDLRFFLKSLGYTVSMKNGIIPTWEINKILADLKGHSERDTVHRVVIRSMAKAIYSTQNIGHYGLAFEHYTHFTSPIRRYPDMLVHRFLIHFLEGKKVAPSELKRYENLARNASEQEKMAADAERASIKYKQVEYMSERIGQSFEGIVSGVSEWGIFIEEKETKCEGMVRLRDMTDDYYVYNEKKLELRGEKRGKTYRLGDRVKIKVGAVDLERKTIDYILI